MNESDAGNKRDGPLHLGKPLLERCKYYGLVICLGCGIRQKLMCIKVVELD